MTESPPRSRPIPIVWGSNLIVPKLICYFNFAQKPRPPAPKVEFKAAKSLANASKE